jgi:hypothetical protein
MAFPRTLRALVPRVSSALSLTAITLGCGGATEGTTSLDASAAPDGFASDGGAESGHDAEVGGDAAAPGEYLAFNPLTNVPRVVVLKADPARDLCFRLSIATFGEDGGIGRFGMQCQLPWDVEDVVVTHHASDCVPPAAVGAAAFADRGAGTITYVKTPQDGGLPACKLTIHATVSSPAGQGAWVPATEALDAVDLAVTGGCE